MALRTWCVCQAWKHPAKGTVYESSWQRNSQNGSTQSGNSRELVVCFFYYVVTGERGKYNEKILSEISISQNLTFLQVARDAMAISSVSLWVRKSISSQWFPLQEQEGEQTTGMGRTQNWFNLREYWQRVLETYKVYRLLSGLFSSTWSRTMEESRVMSPYSRVMGHLEHPSCHSGDSG